MARSLFRRPIPKVICGIYERDGAALFNSAAVFGDGWIEAYRQTWPARTQMGRILPIKTGRPRVVCLGPPQLGFYRVGLMVGSDWFAAEDFFSEYAAKRADAVVLITDSWLRSWKKEMPILCAKYGVVGIVCNNAGDGKGQSCVFDRNGEAKQLATSRGALNFLPPHATYGVASIN